MQTQHHATQAAQYRGDARLFARGIKSTQSDAAIIRANHQHYGDAIAYASERQLLLSELRELRNQMRIAQLLSELHRQFC